ncbi:hypothetical protein CANMA_000338 [Candida margitis]|uniref:uncharacterized protein n=1 Tax=Candida margitis TaxID=1775924 RepID=UPI002226E2C9|nr:uncharacterized protein CANMA_000338 [Candida margitis]KAI5970597.1 hypothetical protein CANMA_000338 [Candida margitis]
MAKSKIIVSSEEEEDSNADFAEEESPLESDSNDNADLDDYDDEEEDDYKPQHTASRSVSQRRRRKPVGGGEDDSREEGEENSLDDEPATSSNEDEEDDMDTNFENELSDMDEDLEPRNDDEEDEPGEILKKSKSGTVKKSIKIKIKPPTKKEEKSLGKSAPGGSRNTRKRQVNYYQDDEDGGFSEELTDVETLPKVSKKIKIKPMPERKSQHQDLDPELILTDEEEEYNPNTVNDVSKMTERQRARLNTEVVGAIEDPYFELDASGKKPKQKKVKEETEEEIALRKAENARKRQDYKNKMLEEEKRDTLNKLLKRRATKSRETIAEDKEGSVGVDEEPTSFYKERRATLNHPALIRYVNNTISLNGNSVLAYK